MGDGESLVTGLVDRFGRVATDLRVSLTDRCNLRCSYCMPAEGLAWLPRDEQLTDDEVGRLIRIGVAELGIREVRFTGGEPLLRRGLLGIVGAAARLTPRPSLKLTTNGIGLEKIAGALKEAGLDRVNVSLDTLDADRFKELTRRDRLDDVLRGLEAAAAAGLTPVKINTVLMRGINEDEAPQLMKFALTYGYQLRFIEQMPLDAQHQWDRHTMVTAEEILAALAPFGLRPDPVSRGTAPAETWLVPGHVDAAGEPARVGVIGSVTRPFCGDCDRTRLTADGQIRNCLFATEESDLRKLLRSGGSDAEIAEAWRAAMRGKRAGHGIDDPSFLQPARPMSAIGG
ncbi:GTP 3',8-cyclase MoaA [Paractinoplanes rhizophilus]|uniref:GTP 3',8-cyclase n=1 Tax=Paractinoplanes rhizophilus TaxID=1416877 RepID=A0ABW2HU57_9ACTN|nr:GTP 3',8-cyclase MoaA [Actinoplanes sp.]